MLEQLTQTSPWLFHVTYESNLARIKRLRRLDSAATLMCAGGETHWLRTRRERMVRFTVDGDPVVLTDQKAINEKNIKFIRGWVLGDLIEAINRRVFFWRGRDGLLAANQGHFRKYTNAGHQMVFLRCRFDAMNAANADRGPELCKYNSGAARQYKGRRIPRGPDTFSSPANAEFSIGDVQEVVFRKCVSLPVSTEVCSAGWSGPWIPL